MMLKVEYIKEDLKVLRDEYKYQIEGVVVDGAKQIKKAVEEIFPTAKIQRCLTHLKRQIRNNISKKPQSNCGKELKKLINFKKFNNDLEGLNGVLDGHIFSHRGLRKDRLISFISIWLYERNL